MGRYFGTDGFRGEANKVLTVDHAFQIGRFLGWYFNESKRRNGQAERAKVTIGKDTRRSSYMFEYALAAGLTASGADAYLLHVTTTPSVSYVARTDGFDCGIMISASHNPFRDNGIKIVNRYGEKAEEELIALIEDYLDGKLCVFGQAWKELPYATGENIGRSIDYAEGRNRYVGYLISLGKHSFKGLKIGLDCANGAAWQIAKSVFDALGATTYVIAAEPNGLNVNLDCGSKNLNRLKTLVKEKELTVGFAFDGDADRCLCVDGSGKEIDGDDVLYICGKYLKERGELSQNTVVGTVMSNLGLVNGLKEEGIETVRTAVGDRFVYEYMQRNGLRLGGEQSGHVIFSKYATTGDGVLTSLKLMEVALEKKSSLTALAKGFHKYPQKTVNLRVEERQAAVEDSEVLASVKEMEEMLGEKGRVLVRVSGTEPLVRVMAEAETEELCNRVVERVCAALKARGYAK